MSKIKGQEVTNNGVTIDFSLQFPDQLLEVMMSMQREAFSIALNSMIKMADSAIKKAKEEVAPGVISQEGIVTRSYEVICAQTNLPVEVIKGIYKDLLKEGLQNS